MPPVRLDVAHESLKSTAMARHLRATHCSHGAAADCRRPQFLDGSAAISANPCSSVMMIWDPSILSTFAFFK